MLTDNVNHPKHYTGKYECIEVMKEVFGEEATENFCKLNAFKYLWRANNKNGKEDIQKAKWYLEYITKEKNIMPNENEYETYIFKGVQDEEGNITFHLVDDCRYEEMKPEKEEKTLAVYLHDIYLEYIDAGFNEKQAFQLMRDQMRWEMEHGNDEED